MPHKHKRARLSSPSTHDLPPTSLAHPLPVSKTPLPARKPSRRKPPPHDDTPRAFARLMSFAATGHKTPRGLDDGATAARSKKRKRSQVEPVKAESAVPKILSGERMGDYAARVDQALPVAGLVGKGKVVDGVRGGRQTRTEKQMQRMQREWREQEARRKAKVEEMMEKAEEDEGAPIGGSGGVSGAGRRKKRKGKGKGGGEDGGHNDEDEDPWAAVAANRKKEMEEKENRRGGLVGLHDVVQAPPKFVKVPEAKVRVGDVVRNGGLKKQVELSEARKDVVEGYRRMMREKRTDKG
ncbi:MAG: hypothetical protein L6R39_004140 [Caloplaca ligustica]|nr:MAG: hypothetical protein L6R39_004140 [Caloplaca ligustica]